MRSTLVSNCDLNYYRFNEICIDTTDQKFGIISV